jgi:hypothetical protein
MDPKIQDIWIFTWLHKAQRSVLKVHPRDDVLNPLKGVFATRSPDRPNPIGLHRAKVLSVDGDRWLQVQALEAIDVLRSSTSSRFSNAAAIFEDHGRILQSGVCAFCEAEGLLVQASVAHASILVMRESTFLS